MDAVEFHPEAAEEYSEAYQWYVDRGERVGAAFETEVERALRLIIEAPERWPTFALGCRRLVVRKFPYSIIYGLQDGRVWVVGVAHQRRRPGYWYHRVGQT